MPKISLTRRATFSASHRLHDPKLGASENQKIFGKCNNPKGHGHNYVLEVTVRGEVDPTTGMLLNVADLKQAIEETVMTEMDHKHLNEDVAAFRGLNPTAENIAIVIWNLIAPKLPRGILHEVKLHETENISVVYGGPSARQVDG